MISVPEGPSCSPSGAFPAICGELLDHLGRKAAAGTSGTGRSVMIPAISQCPVIVSLPRERSRRRPAAARGEPGAAVTPRTAAMSPSPSHRAVGRDEARRRARRRSR